MSDTTDRLIELEIRYTHQARLIDELNDELTAANDRLDALQREISVIKDVLKTLGPDLEVSPDE